MYNNYFCLLLFISTYSIPLYIDFIYNKLLYIVYSLLTSPFHSTILN
nr:MAG TPA: hypothetical protein [Caudoviricetes sp.]